jgi:hypothetical protein
VRGSLSGNTRHRYTRHHRSSILAGLGPVIGNPAITPFFQDDPKYRDNIERT